MTKQWNVFGNTKDEYADCGGDTIVQYRNEVCTIFDCTVRVTSVWW